MGLIAGHCWGAGVRTASLSAQVLPGTQLHAFITHYTHACMYQREHLDCLGPS